jgi:N-acetylglutamate synthase-like GNAT family acetyltransferase
MKIENLEGHKEFISKLAGWHHAQWANLNPGETLEARISRYHERMESDGLPLMFVALSDGVLLGSASLLKHDMDTRMDLSPWLASVYVAAEHRRKGVGEALVARIVEEARSLGHETLYLFTPDKAAFYAKRGWSSMENTEYQGESIEIMSIRPGDSP